MQQDEVQIEESVCNYCKRFGKCEWTKEKKPYIDPGKACLFYQEK